MDVYGKLVKADEFIAVSSSEVYFRTLRGCAWGSRGCTQPLSWRVTDAVLKPLSDANAPRLGWHYQHQCVCAGLDMCVTHSHAHHCLS